MGTVLSLLAVGHGGPGLPHSRLSPVTCGVGQGVGTAGDIIWARKRMAGPDAHSPEPSQALVLYLPPQFVNGSLQMNGLICPQTVGMNLSVGAGEQEGLSTAEHDMNESRTLPVPGEHPECALSQVRGD